MADLDGAGAKLTAKGNLNRKLVESLAGRFQWEGYPPERVWSVNKVLNEDDYTPALYLLGRDDDGAFESADATHAISSHQIG